MAVFLIKNVGATNFKIEADDFVVDAEKVVFIKGTTKVGVLIGLAGAVILRQDAVAN